MSRALRVAAITPYPLDSAGGQRYRIEQWFRVLGEGLFAVDYLPLLSKSDYRRAYVQGATFEKAARLSAAAWRRRQDIEKIIDNRYDVAVLYREAYPFGGPWFERRLFEKLPVVYDFDDAIWLADTSQNNAWAKSLKQPLKYSTVIETAAATTVGNRYLLSFASQYSDRCHVIPTTIDIERYQPFTGRNPLKDAKRVRIGWIGSATTSTYMRSLLDDARSVFKRPDVEVWVIGDPNFTPPAGLEVRVYPWNLSTEIGLTGSFDIGVMPLPDNSWTRGKCGFKALLYMSLGIATVASPVGVNSEIIADRHNGMLATTADDWVNALQALIEDPDLRTRLGAQGRQTVVERYSTQEWAPRFGQIVTEASRYGRSLNGRAPSSTH